MPATYCEVALPIPLRSLFTYAIPERLAGSICAGSRVLVPFRNRAMTGVVVVNLVLRRGVRPGFVQQLIPALCQRDGPFRHAFTTAARAFGGGAGTEVDSWTIPARSRE